MRKGLAERKVRPMAKRGNPVPEGHHTVTPYLVVRGAEEAIEFYSRAFGARETARMTGPGGMIIHAEVQIGDSRVMLSDEYRTSSPLSLGGTPVRLMLYVKDVDDWFRRAVEAGATVEMTPQDMFWGDRYARVSDPFGHRWDLATHLEDLSPEEIRKRQEEANAREEAAKKKAR
jgi:PhnB protein